MTNLGALNASRDTRWRGKIPIPPRAHPLVRELIKAANAKLMMLHEIEAAAGLGKCTIRSWRYRRTPSVPNLVAALNVVGLDLVVAPLEENSS